MDSYWHQRQTLADAAMEKDERALSLRVHNAYESELRRLNREIAEYYQRYGENGVLEYRRLMETMDPKDRELLIRDCDEFLRQHPDMQSIVDVRKSIYQLNRLEGLQASARLHLYQATGDVVQRIDNHIMRQSLRGANTAAEAMGFGRSFYSMDSDAVRRFVDTVWTGNTSYSQRIWDNTETLASYVAQDMSKALARGDSYQRIAKALEKRFVDVPQSSLMRLVYTEGTYVSRMAQVEELKREGFDSYTIEVVHDERACEECEGVSGSTFRFEDMQVGVNFPPLHPYCRCQIAPAVSDWDAWESEQIDRDKVRKVLGFSEGEGELENWKKERENLSVDMEKIRSKTYRSHVRQMFGELSDTVQQDIERMLSHRSGTPYEDLYVYDLTDGARIGSVVTHQKPFEVNPTEEIAKKIRGVVEEGHAVSILHNHPGSSIPSAPDIQSLISTGAKFGVIAAHDGTIYRFEVVGDPAPEYTIDVDTVQRLLQLRQDDSEKKLLEAFERLLGVRIEHLR